MTNASVGWYLATKHCLHTYTQVPLVQLEGLTLTWLYTCFTKHHHIIPIVTVSAAVTVLGSVVEVATMVME